MNKKLYVLRVSQSNLTRLNATLLYTVYVVAPDERKAVLSVHDFCDVS